MTAAPVVDDVEKWAHDNNKQVHVITHLMDLNEPYSCSEWQSLGIDSPSAMQHGGTYPSDYFDWMRDSWNGLPTFAIIDHNNVLRSKPWPLDSNENIDNPCDNNGKYGGLSLQEILEEILDDCHKEKGWRCKWSWNQWKAGCSELNKDNELNIQDVILLVNYILNNEYSPCGDLNDDDVNSVLDIIKMVDYILQK